jgi:hypothetical protein
MNNDKIAPLSPALFGLCKIDWEMRWKSPVDIWQTLFRGSQPKKSPVTMTGDI